MTSYTLNRTKRVKRLALRVIDQEVVVTAPMSVAKSEIDVFVSEHASWVEKQLVKQQGVETWRERMRAGEFMFLGEWCNLALENTLVVPRQQSVENWYVEQAHKILIPKTHAIAEQLGVQVNDIEIKKYKSRWGSCHQSGVIKYSWPLIQAPEKIIDYVVIHECAHRIEMNHSKAFWAIVESLCPTYKQRRKWLQDMTFKLGIL